MDLTAQAVQSSHQLHDAAAHRFQDLAGQLAEQMHDLAWLRQERSIDEDDPDPSIHHPHGKGTCSAHHEHSPGSLSEMQYLEAGAGGGRPTGGAGGGLSILRGGALGGGGAHGGGRPELQGAHRTPLPKISFPRFDGAQPRVWCDKCLDYFRVFNIHPTLWLTSVTLHMDGKATLWLQTFTMLCWNGRCSSLMWSANLGPILNASR